MIPAFVSYVHIFLMEMQMQKDEISNVKKLKKKWFFTEVRSFLKSPVQRASTIRPVPNPEAAKQVTENFLISDHDAVIWCGDFNYRIDLPNPESREKFDKPEFLLKYDQLLTAKKKKKSFY